MCDVKDTHTRHRPIRVDQELWDAFGALVGDRNRSAVIRDFLRWYIGEPGAEMPARPADGKPERPDDAEGLRKQLQKARNELVHRLSKEPVFSSDLSEALSPLEFRILVLMAEGIAESEVAAELKMSRRRLDEHVKTIAGKVRSGAKIYTPVDEPSD